MTQSLTDLHKKMIHMGDDARDAARLLASASTETKNKALMSMAHLLRERQDDILAANATDLKNSEGKEYNDAFINRLTLDAKGIEGMASGMEAIAQLDDPVGELMGETKRPNGLHIRRVRVPLGVVGVIFESRPNVTADAGALCLKAGNAVILRPGSESFATSRLITDILVKALAVHQLPPAAIQMVPTASREAVGILLSMSQYIDVLVPRGGQSLVARVAQDSRIPVLYHLMGLCHSYVHEDADRDKAVAVCVNAKMRRSGICGATETILLDESIVSSVGRHLVTALLDAQCTVRGDDAVCALDNRVQKASDNDWDTEYLDDIVSIKSVAGIDEALAHIARHGSLHTEAIITENEVVARRFLQEVDAAIVMHNASTQFADGGEFGMGAEIGIATGRLHARGPVGLRELTSYKYQVVGDGQCRP